MAHIGFTPQSEHRLGGHRVQGRGEGAEELLQDALAVEDAGAFAVVLEMVPSEAAKRVTERLTIPTIGVGAGPHVDGQLLVWTDFAGLTSGRGAEVREALRGPPGRARAGGHGLPRRGRLRRLPGPRARVRVSGQSSSAAILREFAAMRSFAPAASSRVL